MGSPSIPFRKGKYPEWIGGSNEALSGFSWKSGSDRHTTGIIIWSDVFLYDAPNGDKIAIILMDTQGLFDRHSSATDNSRIFSLSTLISSVQIFNLFNHIQEDHLQYLQFATDYAKFAMTNNGEQHTKPFQNLMFLIRDWNFPDDYEYGLQGGHNLLKVILKIENSQLPELKSLRQYIFESFDEISCFLMPHPGTVVATKKNYDGQWSQIETDFVDQLKDLVKILLSPDKLTVKKINGQDVQVNEFYLYISEYIQMFKSQDLPEPQTIFEATVANHMQILVARSFSIYNQIVMAGYSNMTELNQIEVLHKVASDIAVEVYSKEKKMGTKDHDTNCMNDLVLKIGDAFKIWEPTANKQIKRIQELKKMIEEEQKSKLNATEQTKQAQEILNLAKKSLADAELEVARVKAESLEIRAEAKAIQLEAQNIQNAAIRKEQEAEKLVKAAKEREFVLKIEMEAFKELMKSQQEATKKQMEQNQKILQNIRDGQNGNEETNDNTYKWVSMGFQIFTSFATVLGFLG